MAVSYFDAALLRRVEATVRELRQTRLLVENRQDQKLWPIPSGAMNLAGWGPTSERSQLHLRDLNHRPLTRKRCCPMYKLPGSGSLQSQVLLICETDLAGKRSLTTYIVAESDVEVYDTRRTREISRAGGRVNP
jgi:hypothetical protein